MVSNKNLVVLMLILLVIETQAFSRLKHNLKFKSSINPTQCGRRIDEIRQGRVNKIVGGQQADPEDWGWQIGLEIGGSFKCGGSLVNKEWVITAAHCIISNDLSRYTIKLGLHNRLSPESYSTTRKVSQIILHPNYDEKISRENDIALIKLISPVEYTDQILPICLPSQNYDFTNKMAWATGWGTLNSDGFPATNLMEVEMPILSNLDCMNKYLLTEGYYINTANSICAGEKGQGKDTCQGDSGGPLVVKVGERWQLAGITSWGIGCGDGGVYTKTTFYMDWILSYIQTFSVSEHPTTFIETTSKEATKTMQANSSIQYSEFKNLSSSKASASRIQSTSKKQANSDSLIIQQIFELIINFLKNFQIF